MDEYISKEKAIKELREVYENEYPTASGDFDEYASHDVPNILRNMKAADVQSVKRGRWLLKFDGDIYEYRECSKCGNTGSCETPYCAQCGARMKQDGDTDA